jgi:urease accessory protein UreH
VTAVANDLHLAAEFRDERTVLSRVRADGLWRTSRPFREGNATRIVLSHLGPGMIQGDSFRSTGTVSANAHLIVREQMATRILPGRDPVNASAAWTVNPGGRLDLILEPVLVTSGASYYGKLLISAGANSVVLVSELIVCESGASATTSLMIERDGRVEVIDNLRLEGPSEGTGTLVIVGHDDSEALNLALAKCEHVRVGVGKLRGGALLARVAGPISAVQTTLANLRTELSVAIAFSAKTFARVTAHADRRGHQTEEGQSSAMASVVPEDL